jgi:hypothetical protein
MTYMPISISTFRASFRDLQVGDQVLEARGSFTTFWEVLTVTKLTETQFVCGTRRFKRTTGDEVGRRFHGVTLPNPERLAEINADMEERAIRRALGQVDFRVLPLNQARRILEIVDAS